VRGSRSIDSTGRGSEGGRGPRDTVIKGTDCFSNLLPPLPPLPLAYCSPFCACLGCVKGGVKVGGRREGWGGGEKAGVKVGGSRDCGGGVKIGVKVGGET